MDLWHFEAEICYAAAATGGGHIRDLEKDDRGHRCSGAVLLSECVAHLEWRPRVSGLWAHLRQRDEEDPRTDCRMHRQRIVFCR